MSVSIHRLQYACRHHLFRPTAFQTRFAMMSALSTSKHPDGVVESPPTVVPAKQTSLSPDAASPQTAAAPPPAPKAERPRPKIRSTKTILTMTPRAVVRLEGLLKGPTPQLIRIGVKNKGCAGLAYHLEYVEKPGKFDEVVSQDGVRVLVDSKAMFSIIGSEMDWTDDALSSKFTFRNPNIEDSCGCGESFKVGG